jgi:excinuclease ABC subunit B
LINYVSFYNYDCAVQKITVSILEYSQKKETEKGICSKRKQMEANAKELDFVIVAQLRDEIVVLKEKAWILIWFVS